MSNQPEPEYEELTEEPILTFALVRDSDGVVLERYDESLPAMQRMVSLMCQGIATHVDCIDAPPSAPSNN